ncbi:MAG: magnesium-translocating P-type ATPase [Verrucomicrobia bacterium]|nr:magnesium-translocating P-type ATPase [Verrucomicrobiota bacterium]
MLSNRTQPKAGSTKRKPLAASLQIRPQTLDGAYSSVEEVLLSLGTSEQGLSDREAQERLAKGGPNEVTAVGRVPLVWQFLKNFGNPFVALLCTLSLISFFLGNLQGGVLILVMVAISVLMRFVQEFRSGRTVAELRALVGTTVTVIRVNDRGESCRREIPLRGVVPGDIVTLSAGDMVPGDVRMLSTRDLFVSQSVLTGEALPVEKFETFQMPNRRTRPLGREDPTEVANLGLMGTNIVSGTATAVVLATGDGTLFGSLTRKAISQRALTSFDRGINRISWLLIRAMLLMVPVVLLLNGLSKGDWGSSFLFALSVAVGLTPEMLPVVIAANLTRGAVAMSRNRVIVKRLSSIEDLGAMSVLCTDKTGTLTIDRIILERHLDVLGNEDDEVLKYAYLNSYFQSGLKNLLDAAILEHGELHEALRVSESYRKVDEIPFDFGRRRMSVILEKQRQQHELICKGAVEEMLSICSFAKLHGKIVPLSLELTSRMSAVRNEMNEKGLRVLAVAYKQIGLEDANYQYRIHDETGLILAGFIAFLDPPKESTAEALAALRQRGVTVKILTGDNELVTRRICRWVDLEVDRVLSGSEVESMDDSELRQAVVSTTVFTKLSPLQKARVISALKLAGNTVGYLGDGINDAPALREADVGISVDTAVDVAKECADIVMLEKSLTTLVDVVMEGRRNSANIVKYVKMAASSNFGNVLTVLGASAFLSFLPILPLQLLVQNLLYDISQITIAFDPVDPQDIAGPRRWETQSIGRFMLFLGPISSLFDLVTFGVLFRLFEGNTAGQHPLFQSGWFIEGLLSQTLIVYMLRTRKIPFVQSWPAGPLLTSTIIVMMVAVVLPFSSIGSAIGLVPVPPVYFFWLIGILLAYCLAVQVIKKWYLARFGSWI